MKVGIECVIGHIINKPNNAESFLKNFLKYLPKQDNICYYLFVDNSGWETVENEGKDRQDFIYINVGRNKNKIDRVLIEQVKIPHLANKYKLDVYCSIISNELPLWGRFKKVLRVSSLAILHYSTLFGIFTRFYRKIFNKLFIKRADLVIANSMFMKHDLVKFFKFNPNSVPMIYESVDPFWSSAGSDAQARKNFQQFNIQSSYILYVSGLTKYKNPILLLKAFIKLKTEKNIDYNLVFVGTGDQLGLMQRYILQHHMEKHVIFTGFLDKHTLRYVYQHAALVVHPSLYEATGNVLLQAMAMNVPLVAANIASIPEIVGDAAILFDPYDVNDLAISLMRIIEDKDLQNRLIKNGAARIRMFSDWNRDLRQFINAVETVE